MYTHIFIFVKPTSREAVGGMEIQLHVLLASAVGGGEWLNAHLEDA